MGPRAAGASDVVSNLVWARTLPFFKWLAYLSGFLMISKKYAMELEDTEIQ